MAVNFRKRYKPIIILVIFVLLIMVFMLRNSEERVSYI